MVGKAVATMVCNTTSDQARVRSAKRYLIECGEESGTHETEENDSEAIFRDNVLFLLPPGRARFSLWWWVLEHDSGRGHGQSGERGKENTVVVVDGERTGTSWSAGNLWINHDTPIIPLPN